MHSITLDLEIALLLFGALLLALEAGFRAGRRAAAEQEARAGAQVGAIQGAVLGLLGLLLGFSFAAAGARFLERQDLIVTEANAIGTAYLRADLLPEPARSELRSALKEYTLARIEASERLPAGLTADDLAIASRLHARMWQAALAGVQARPEFDQTVLPPVNDVIDLHSTRLAAGRKRLPALVLGLLISSSLLAIGSLGYGTGTTGRRRLTLTLPLLAIVGAALWVTVDLDQPRAGLMQLNDGPLKAISFD